MELRFDPSGMVTIVAGTHSHGQGHATVYAQMVSEWLGVPFGNIRFVQGDTNAVPFGRGTYASRSMQVGGNALKSAADAIIEKAKPMAAHLMEAAAGDVEFKDGRFGIVGTDRSMALTDVAKAFYRPAHLPPQFEVGLEAAGSFASEPPNYPNGCHICEVEVDPDTGAVAVVRYHAVDDVGRVMNHLLCEGQIHGGVAQGVGQALMEAVLYDGSGQLVTGSFQDYCMPRADDLPEIVSELTEVPSTTNPLGVKAAGEAGCTGAPPAVIGAILDALRPLGVEHIDMPATPSRVWAAIQRAKDRMLPNGGCQLDVAVVGAGPAGLMAAEVLAQGGARVTVFDRMPAAGRKFLLAGRGGLNLTHSEPLERVPRAAMARRRRICATRSRRFRPRRCAPGARRWGRRRSSDRAGGCFPSSLKASPLLRAWLRRLDAAGVVFKPRHRWTGWDDDGALTFETPSGVVTERADATVLALGGASWPRLGSDGSWAEIMTRAGIADRAAAARQCRRAS